MASNDSTFAGSIPEYYDRYLGPFLFEPYAADLAVRVAQLAPRALLEIAAGTGIVTRAIAAAVPQAQIVATDLNPGMIAIGERNASAGNVRWQQADAMALPFADGAFDCVVCQYGVMFFPDILASLREVRRVLAPGGTYLFSVWRSLAFNPAARVIVDVAAQTFPTDPPHFLERTPHGHDDPPKFEAWLREAGFTTIVATLVEARARSASWGDCALGFVHGSPLRMEIEARDASKADAIVAAVTAVGQARHGAGAVDVPLAAYVYAAR